MLAAQHSCNCHRPPFRCAHHDHLRTLVFTRGRSGSSRAVACSETRARLPVFSGSRRAGFGDARLETIEEGRSTTSEGRQRRPQVTTRLMGDRRGSLNQAPRSARTVRCSVPVSPSIAGARPTRADHRRSPASSRGCWAICSRFADVSAVLAQGTLRRSLGGRRVPPTAEQGSTGSA